MSSHPQSEPTAQGEGPDVLLIGNPNVGKSVVFGLLTGTYVVVSNYPGTTVEISTGRLRGLGPARRVVDTPGVNDLEPMSMDEVVTRDYLVRPGDKIVVQVIDATHLTRGLKITSQLADFGVPLVICLNMVDEARRAGIEIDTRALSERLGVEVVPTVAIERRGISQLFQAINRARPAKPLLELRRGLETAVADVASLLPAGVSARRWQAVSLLTAEKDAREAALAALPAEVARKVGARVTQAHDEFQGSIGYAVARSRWGQVEALAAKVTTHRTISPTRLRECVSAACMHPAWGTLIVLGVLYVMYLLVGRLGAGTCVDFLQNSVFGSPERLLYEASGSGMRDSFEVGSGVAAIVTDQGITLRPETRTRAGSQGARVLVTWHSMGRVPLFSDRHQYRIGITGRVKPAGASAQAPELRVTQDGAPQATDPGQSAPPANGGGGIVSPSGEFRVAGILQPSADHSACTAAVIPPPANGPYSLTITSLAVTRQACGLINPFAYYWVTRLVPWPLVQDMLVGEYGLITMGLTYAVAIVLPIVGFFFLFFGVLEDSGYLPRLTVMANRTFRLMGLNGKAVLPMVLGLGCGTMATLTARIMDSRKSQLIVIFLLALGVPCSAQLGVVLGMLGNIGSGAVIAVFAIVGLQMLIVGTLANRVLPGGRDDFIIEIPLIRLPQLSNVAIKTVQRVEWFLREAVPYFLLGTFILFALSRLGALVWIESAAKPVVTGLLGLPPEAARAFLIGFLRRDYGAAGLFDMRLQGKLDGLQTVVAMVTITLFVPCIASFFIMVKERGLKTGAAIVAFIFPVAILTGAVVNIVFRALGLSHVFGP